MMCELLSVAILWVPDTRLSPNVGTPTRTMKRLRAASKAIATMAIRDRLAGARIVPYDGPVHFDVTVYWPKGRKVWDADNLSSALKACFDAFEAEGVIVNDRQADAPTIRQARDDGQGFVFVRCLTRAADATARAA